MDRDRERIRERRDALKISQEELAAYARVDQSQISRAEGGKGAPVSKRMLAKILTALSTLETSGIPAATKTQAGEMGTAAKSGGAGTVLEMALGRAFLADKHLLRDAVAVQREFQHIALPQMTAAELQLLCGRWLARLRNEGTPVTSEAISAVLSVEAMRAH